MGKIVRIFLQEKKVSEEEIPKGWELLGGRGISGKIISSEVPPEADPLGSKNKLIFAPGLLGGCYVSSSGRLSVGAKSPLTGGIKESNVGGTAGQKLSRLGISALVLEGISKEPSILLISKDGVKFESATDLVGLKTYELVEKIKSRYDEKNAIIGIGPAGDKKLFLSGIFVSDIEGRPCRYAARGGLGAVMGSKNVKAILIDDKGANGISYDKRDEFLTLSKSWGKELIESRKVFTEYGTAVLIKIINELGGLPTRNFRVGSFKDADKISGETLRENALSRGGRMGHPCHPGCVIRCSNIYHDKNGNYLTSALEYETIGLMGANLEIGDLDAVAEFDRMCDELGIDTIETANSIAVAMEAGLFKFGDANGVKEALGNIEKGTVIGRIIGSGAKRAAETLGVKRAAHVKGQALSSYDPRCIKGTGVTFLTSPMGADHTAANILPGRTGYHFYDVDDDGGGVTSKEKKVEISRDVQIMVAVCDTLGFCFFVGPNLANMEFFAKLIKARFGYNCSAIDLIEMGKDVITTEIEFNKKAGIPPVSTLPEFFYKETLKPKDLTFDIDEENIKKIWE
ncbi:MAG: aldehyde ferredoxin oxidoreductase [Deltaproteobacteria bacterium]|nr:MAG: aldehyde ferredoxin oxidoreductase [Deltaproteobacteria bacterium]